MATTPVTPYASASLYVGDLATDVTEALLFEIFNAVGPVASVRVCRDAATRRSLGYAYVNFHRVDDAERALDTMNFKPIRSRPCRIMWSHRDPSLRRSGRGNIFVKNLASTIDNKSLYDTFSMFGNILSCKVATSQKGDSLKYGFVHYESDEAAEQAIKRVNGKVIANEKVTVSAFKSRKERGVSGSTAFTNVYVKNIPAEIDEVKLNEMFAEHGVIQSCSISMDKEGKSRGFGFVNFEDADAAAVACEKLNDLEIGEKKLFVGRAQKKEEREKELRDRFEQLKVERQKKYAGVNLYVKNLSDQIDEARLRTEFAKFGSITSARVMTEAASGKSKGFGFVCFSTPEEATKAVAEMNTKMLDNKPLYVALAQRKDQRRQQLEQQYATRKGGPGMQPHMFPGQPGQPGQPGPPPMGYYPGMPQRMVYPTQQMMQRWNGPGQQGGAAMMAPHPGVNYQLMAINQRGGGRGGGRGGRQSRGKGGPQGGNFKYTDNVRNREQRPMQQQQQAPQQPQQAMPAAEQAVPGTGGPEPLTIKALAAAPEEARKQMIGERLFPLIKAQQPTEAGKITGMLLEMDNGELLHLLESQGALKEKLDEAMMVLQDFASQA